MPRKTKTIDVDRLFGGIKPGAGDRGEAPDRRRKSATLKAKPADRIVAESENMMTIALTIERELYEKYNAGKSRGRYGAAMREQLWKKFK